MCGVCVEGCVGVCVMCECGGFVCDVCECGVVCVCLCVVFCFLCVFVGLVVECVW